MRDYVDNNDEANFPKPNWPEEKIDYHYTLNATVKYAIGAVPIFNAKPLHISLSLVSILSEPEDVEVNIREERLYDDEVITAIQEQYPKLTGNFIFEFITVEVESEE